MDKRREKEEQYMEARRRRVEEDQRQLEAQRVQARAAPFSSSEARHARFHARFHSTSCGLEVRLLPFRRTPRMSTS